MKENYPLITEQKGNRYLEKNKIQMNVHNISSCILLAKLYNNSIDFLNSIKNKLKLKKINENNNIAFFKNINRELNLKVLVNIFQTIII